MCDLISRQAERLGGRSHAVGRPARPQQNVAGQPEQPPATFGVDHLVGGEPETVQVLDQARPIARIGDSRGLQRVEIDHR